MKTLLTLLSVLLLATSVSAQTGKLMKRYYISGSLAIGKDNRSFADSTSWIDIGPDTTDRGIRFPKVLLDSINTTQRALFVYDLQDSVLYHFDGSQRVRYMTYKDTAFLKNNFLAQGGNAYGKTVTVGSKDNNNVDVIANDNTVMRVFANGNVSVGGDTTTDNYAMNIDGGGDDAVLRLYRGGNSTFLKTETHNDNAYIHTLAIGKHRIKTKSYGISFSAVDNEDTPNGTDIFRIKNVYNSSTYSPLKVLGANNEPYLTLTGLGALLIGVADGDAVYGAKAQVNGTFIANTIANRYVSSQPYLKVEGNEHLLLQSANGSNGIIYLGMAGVSPDFNYPFTSVERSGVLVNRSVTPVIGSENLVFNGIQIKNSVNYSSVTGDNNIFRGIYYNPTITGNVEQRAIELNNVNGWGIYQNNLGVKNFFNGNTSFGSTSNTAKVDITSTTGYNQLRLRTSYTPTGTGDTNGNVGDVSWDDGFIYIKTSTGWKRSQLISF